MIFTKLKKQSAILFLLGMALSAHAQSVDELIAQHINALGGREKLKAVSTVKMTLKGVAQGFEFPVEMYSTQSGSMKSVTTIQNMKMIQAYSATDSVGWYVNPMSGDKRPQKMNTEQIKQLQEQGGKMEPELLDYQQKGHVVEYLGKEDMDGEEVDLLRLTKKDGSIVYYYIDAASHLILKEKTKSMLRDKEIEGELYYSNYQTTDGLTSARTMENMNNGVPVFQINVEKLEYNIKIDDKEFSMPQEEKAVTPGKE